jgi:hypothetical protein
LQVIRAAFPKTHRADVDAVLALLPAHDYDPSIGGTPNERGRWAIIEAEIVQAIGRIGNPVIETRASESLSPDQAQILACLYSRHVDGWVREQQITRVLAVEAPWTPMFILQLLGEYVIEIGAAVWERSGALDLSTFKAFGEANPDFIAVTCEQIVSYWACYYSSIKLVNYPAYQVMRFMGLWLGNPGKRWISREKP